MGIVVRVYAWLYLLIKHANQPLGPAGRLSDANAGACAFMTTIAIGYIGALFDLLLPIDLADSPFLWPAIVGVNRTVYGESGTQTTTYTYDSLNRLIATEGPSGSAEYAYDGVGNRVWKRDADGLTVYLRHGEIAVAMEVSVPTSDDATIDRYVLSGDLIAGRVRTSGETTERAWYHLDHLNSTKLVTDEDGEVVVSYTYRAFGEQLRRLDADNAETGDEATYSYGGKELDDTDLYYFNARYYDPALGRFITVDPAQDGENWYAYVNNNPLALVDPTGLEPRTERIRTESFGLSGSQVQQVNNELFRANDRRSEVTAGDILKSIVGNFIGMIPGIGDAYSAYSGAEGWNNQEIINGNNANLYLLSNLREGLSEEGTINFDFTYKGIVDGSTFYQEWPQVYYEVEASATIADENLPLNGMSFPLNPTGDFLEAFDRFEGTIQTGEAFQTYSNRHDAPEVREN